MHTKKVANHFQIVNYWQLFENWLKNLLLKSNGNLTDKIIYIYTHRYIHQQNGLLSNSSLIHINRHTRRRCCGSFWTFRTTTKHTGSCFRVPTFWIGTPFPVTSSGRRINPYNKSDHSKKKKKNCLAHSMPNYSVWNMSKTIISIATVSLIHTSK